MSKKRRKSKNTGLKIMLFLFVSVIGAAAVISAVKLKNISPKTSEESSKGVLMGAESEPYTPYNSSSDISETNPSTDSGGTVSLPNPSLPEEPIVKPAHSKKLIKAKHIYQQDKWPTGCESVSAVMALHYAGIDISVDHFINNCLEKKTPPFDPNIQFGGDPHDSGGWGCYSPVIK